MASQGHSNMVWQLVGLRHIKDWVGMYRHCKDLVEMRRHNMDWV